MKRNESDALKYPDDKVIWVGEWNHGGKNFISDNFLFELIEEVPYVTGQTLTVTHSKYVFQWHDRYGQRTDSITYTPIAKGV